MSEKTQKAESSFNQIGSVISRVITAMGPLLVLLFLYILLYALSPAFRSPRSAMLVALEGAAIGIAAAGQTYVILTGGIDLSIEAMVSFSGVVGAILIAGTNVAGGQIAFGIPSWQACLIAIAAGLVIGLIQGALVTGMRMNPFIVTLGFRSMLLGISLVWTNGAGINIKQDLFLKSIAGPVNVLGVGVPAPFLIAIAIYVVVWFSLAHTKHGRYTYAIGGNKIAARLSGINVDRTEMFIYGISGLLAAVAGVLVMARLQSGAYQNGTNMTLASVAAVVIGGTALSGGAGGVWGTLIGVFIIRVVEAGLVYLSVPSSAKEIVIGFIIILAVALDVVRRGEVPWLRAHKSS